MCCLIFVLGDQLSLSLSALRAADPARDVVLMVEVAEETSYVPHHKKKIAFIFSAMRAFADELRATGWQVDYVKLDEPHNSGSFSAELSRAVLRHKPERIMATEASEWRVLEAQRAWVASLGIPVELRPDDRFLCTPAEFAAWASARKQLRMEYFYRDMRRKTGLLMDGYVPVGGQWNFDQLNRKSAKRATHMPPPFRLTPSQTTAEVLALVAARFAEHFGDLEPFWFPVTRADAEQAVARFLTEALPQFGDYQDAMLRDEPFLHHSLLSPLINVGLIDPLDLCQRVEAEYRAGRVPLNAAEGFIRQIIGWREYVRGIYWLNMPGYIEVNGLGATRALPGFYWTGDTDMQCMASSIGQTKSEAYAHHIQRLMVTGNFALLTGIDPHELHIWYLAVYLDAFEWVEAPNTIGMSQFADNGILASKPYAASGAYIDRMSDYCGTCRYDVKAKIGSKACPLNALYWDFLSRHRVRFVQNPRMAQMYRTYDKLSEAHRAAMADHARRFLTHLEVHGTDRGWQG
jgi:deoxyribodipyrimidine photolyase-related protein